MINEINDHIQNLRQMAQQSFRPQANNESAQRYQSNALNNLSTIRPNTTNEESMQAQADFAQ